MVHRFEQDIACIKFLVVSGLEVYSNNAKEADILALWIAFKWGVKLRVFNTAIYGKIEWCSFQYFEQCIISLISISLTRL